MNVNFAKILNKIQHDFPQFNFAKSVRSYWSPSEQKIYFCEDLPELFHELGHAISGHKNFVQDIELIKMEREAWIRGAKIALNYDIKISSDEIENALDDYREWIHERSLCPNCTQTGLQSRNDLSYLCLNCGTKWIANDSRKTSLRRRKIK